MKKKIPTNLSPIIKIIKEIGGTPVAVGGMPRNELLGLPYHDIDIEVFGIDSLDILKKVLSPLGSVNEIGKSFQVLKLKTDTLEIDFSLPRLEEKTGPGHKGFTVETDTNISFKEAAKRRDFTINSMGKNLLTGELLDPYNGQEDLKNKVLRAVSDQFEEDPLRVFRAMQFAARFDLTIDDDTLKRCRNMPIEELPKERLFEEFKKLFLLSKRPSIGLNYLEDLGISRLFPELMALQETIQDPEWHPEGDVWVHTMMVLDEMATVEITDPFRKLALMFAALCHDFGKPETTEFFDGHWRSHGHEKAGVIPSKNFLQKLTDEKKLFDFVLPLVEHHLKPSLLYKSSLNNKVSDAAIRRLALKVNTEDLLILAHCDHFGRETKEAKERLFPAGDWLESRLEALQIPKNGPSPFLKGQHLIDLGLHEGPELGKVLEACFSLQLDGEISSLEEALDWAKEQLSN